QSQLLVGSTGEIKSYPLFIERNGLFDVGVIVRIKRRSLGGECGERKDDVIGRNLFTIMEARIGVQVINHPAAVLRILNLFSYQTVLGERLIHGGCRQGIVDQRKIAGRCSFGDKRVKAIKGAQDRKSVV